MADEKNGTIYQQLNKLLNLDGFGFQDVQSSISQSTPPNPAKIIIKGTSPEDIQRKGLELQQKKELQNKFFRTTDRGFQKALQYEAARLPAYIDYEGMEYYPIISSALDLFMEEATTIGLDGKMLNIYSNKERIKSILEEFFYDNVNVNVTLPFWTRNLVKYGDEFVLLYGERKKGITHVKQLVNYEIERFERIQNGKPLVKFKERMTGDEFNTFEIAHFRLLGDDKYIPYGSSVLNKVRRVFRQLCLDSNTDIWTLSGYTKIKNLTLGDKIYSYDYEKNVLVPTRVKNVIKTGQKERFAIKTRHRELILTEDHPLLIKNGNNEFLYKNINEIDTKTDKLILPTIKEGLSEFKVKLDSADYHVLLTEAGKIKAKSIESVGILEKLKSLNCKTTLMNLYSFIRGYGRSVIYDDYLKICSQFNLTLEDVDLYYFNSRKKAIVDSNLEFVVNSDFIRLFGFMLGDGWINYHNSSVGFALGVYEDENEYYENLIKNLGSFTSGITKPKAGKGGQINFRSKELVKIFEKLDFRTGAFNKIIPNWVFSLSYENKINFIRGIFDADGCDSNHLYSSSNFDLINGLRILSQSCNLQVGRVLINKFNNKFGDIEVDRKQTYSLYLYLDGEKECDFAEEKIISIDNLGVDDVWDIEVENELHNFIANGIVVHNCMAEDAMLTYRIIRAGEKKVFKIDVGNIDEDDIENYIYKVATKFKKSTQVSPNDGQIDYRFNILGNDEDYFLPVRNANTQTGIETLPGASNLSDIQDIEYLRDNLFIGLSIPKPFLSFQDAAGAGKNMAQYDIRFAKKINRIQQALIQELNKMAMIHLYLLGYSGDDLNDFVLTLTNPSVQQELLKAELLREKAQTYTELTRAEGGIAAMSHTNAKRILFNMSDKGIVDDLKQQKMEKVVMQELADSPVTIKKSGLFSDIDKKFGEPTEGLPTAPATGATEMGGGAIGGGGGAPMLPPVGGPTPTAPVGGAPELGGAPAIPAVGGGGPAAPPMMENKGLSEEQYNSLVEKLVFGNNPTTEPENKKKKRQKEIIKENDSKIGELNVKAHLMMEEIDDLIKKGESFNTTKSRKTNESLDLEGIEDIVLDD